MQPHLGIHQNGLTGCNTIDGEYRVHGNIALEQRQTYRTEFVMHGNATELPHFSSLQNHRGSRIRQFGVGPVKHEHGETPWRTAQIVHSRHGFLTAVTPLVEVRGVQPDLVGDGARIGVEADARVPEAIRVASQASTPTGSVSTWLPNCTV